MPTVAAPVNAVEPPEIALGARVGGRFEILSVLGSGGMGIVYKARDRELDEVVALKMLRREVWRDAEHLERLKSELKLARKITHPNVLRTYDFAEVDGVPFAKRGKESGRKRVAGAERVHSDRADGGAGGRAPAPLHGDGTARAHGDDRDLEAAVHQTPSERHGILAGGARPRDEQDVHFAQLDVEERDQSAQGGKGIVHGVDRAA